MFARELNCSAKTGGGTRIWQGGGGTAPFGPLSPLATALVQTLQPAWQL